MDPMTPRQCRNARKLLGWTQLDLEIEVRCNISINQQFEDERPAALKHVRSTLRRAFESKGVEFILEDGIGVRARFRTSIK